MKITRVNPDWHWFRQKVEIDESGMITANTGDLPRYRPPWETPALHLTLADYFDDMRKSVGQEPGIITDFIARYGRLDEQSNIKQFIDHAALIYWCVRALQYLDEGEFDPTDTKVFEADRAKAFVPNFFKLTSDAMEKVPAIIVPPDGPPIVPEPISAFRAIVVQANMNHPTYIDASTASNISLPVSAILGTVASAIDYGMDRVNLKYESLFNYPRDRHGVRRVPGNAADVTHRLERVAEPRDLLGYIYLCLADQFESLPNITYDACDGVGLGYCRNYLTRMKKNQKRRRWCGEACRARANRSKK
jgi:hypothetical protein